MSRPTTPPLIGRSALLDELAGDLRAAGGGRLGVTLLSGPPGIGKTRILSEIVARHRHRVLTLVGRSYPLGGTDGLGLWVDAIEGHLRELTAADVERLCGPSLADLSDLLPSAGLALGRPVARPARGRVLHGLRQLLTNLSRDAPVLIGLDDVHLADGSSWAALSYLAHHLAASPILVVMAARPAALAQDRAASDVVMALQQEGILRRCRVGPLDHDHVGELATYVLGDQANDRVTNYLMGRSRGVPLFALGLLRALLEEGADLAHPQLSAVPEDLTDYVVRQLAALPAIDRALLELVAVLGAPVEFDVLLALAPELNDDVIRILGRLVDQQLVVEGDRGNSVVYELAHPLIQEAIYHSIGAPRRRALHRAAARTLLASGRSGLAAGHFVRSAGPDDEEAIAALCAALAEAEDQDNHREALALLEALLDIVPAGDRRWIAISDVMTWQSGWVIDHRADVGFETALRAMRRIDSLLDGSAALDRRASAKFHLGSFLVWGAGDIPAGGALVEEAARLFEEVGDRRSVLLARNELGYILAIGGDLEGLASAARTVLPTAESQGDRVVQLQALCSLAHALLWGGHVSVAAPVVLRALELAKEDGNRYRFSYLLGQRGYERALCGDMPAAHGLLMAARDAHASFMDTHVPDYTSFVEWLGGSLAAGVKSGREALAWDGGRISRRRVFGGCFAALCALEMGADEEPARFAAAGRATFGGRNWWFHSALPDWVDGSARFAGGDHEGALHFLGRAVDHVAAAGTHLWASFLLAELAEVAAAIGDGESLVRSTAIVDGPAPGSTTPGQDGLARFAAGAVAVTEGRTSAAMNYLRSSITAFGSSGWRLWEARALCLLARVLSQHDRAGAVHAYVDAVRILQDCGAERRLAVVRRALGDLGTAGRRVQAATGVPSRLTRREREAAGHVLGGASAREIGLLMFIGERTVETHLAHVYAKLGVRGRQELTRRYRESGLP